MGYHFFRSPWLGGLAAFALILCAAGAGRATPPLPLLDLGTLGGAHSEAYAISPNGAVVGAAHNANGRWRAFVWKNGIMTDLGVLPGLYESRATKINSAGDIIGGSWPFGQPERAYLYRNGVMSDLTLPGSTQSWAHDLNEAGDAVGYSVFPGALKHVFLYRGSTLTYLTLGGNRSEARDVNEYGDVVGYAAPLNGTDHAFLYRGGVMMDLGVPAGRYSAFATRINNAGDVIGRSIGFDGWARPFLYRNGVMYEFGLGGTTNDSDALDINEAGQVVGYACLANRDRHAFLYENGTIKDLGTLGGRESFAQDINEAGDIVGWSNTPSGAWHAFLYRNGVMTDLGTLGGPNSFAYAVLNNGWVIGRTSDGGGWERVFAYSDGVMYDLGTLGGLTSTIVWSTTGLGIADNRWVNEAGQITGWSALSNGPKHAFLTAVVANRAPVASADSVATQEDVAAFGNVLGNDTDEDGNTLTAETVSQPAHGTLQMASEGFFTYVPEPDYNGTDSFTYRAHDGESYSEEATVTISVTPVNDAPVFVDAGDVTVAEDSGPGSITGWATMINAGAADEAGQALQFLVTNSNPALFSQSPTLSPEGTLTFTPAGNANGEALVTVNLRDDGGTEDGGADTSAPHTFTLQVSAVNDAPTISADAGAVSVSEGDSAANNGAWADIDGDLVSISASVGVAVRGAGGTWSWSHIPADGPAESGDVTITADDGQGGQASTTFAMSVANADPVFAPPVSQTASEGQAVDLDLGAFSDAGAGDGPWSISVDWGDGTPPAQSTVASAGSLGGSPHSYADDSGNSTYSVTVTIRDKDGGETSGAFPVAVANAAPAVSISGPGETTEGALYTLSLSTQDSGQDVPTHWTVDWGDGDVDQLDGNPSSATHEYADGPNAYTVSASATDEDGTWPAGATLEVVVNNAAPVVSGAAGQSVPTGTAAACDLGSFTDAGAADGDWSVNVQWGDGTSDTFTRFTQGPLPQRSHTYATAGTHDVVVTVTDKDGGMGVAIFSITAYIVANNPPEVGPITAPVAPIVVNDIVTASAPFHDADLADAHTAVWEWGDGATTTGSVSESGGSGIVEDQHVYSTPGVYTITLRVSDGRDTTTVTHSYIVVYDPNGGFVTGGGWINSPAGAYSAAPSLSGKATFGFVSKYLPGANVPTGNTEFQFRTAGLNYRSDTYEWLVVSGAKAQFKGSGSLNGTPGFLFMVTAVDGNLANGVADTFRIKITGPNGLVYDNLMNAPDTSDPTTVLGGGSIVIHK